MAAVRKAKKAPKKTIKKTGNGSLVKRTLPKAPEAIPVHTIVPKKLATPRAMPKTKLKKASKHSREIRTFMREGHVAPRPMSFRGQHGEGEYIGLVEPTWPPIEEQIQWTKEYRNKLVGQAFAWYNYTQDKKTAYNFFLKAFDKVHHRAKMLANIKKSNTTPNSVCGWICRMAAMGLYLHMSEKRVLWQQIKQLLADTKSTINAGECAIGSPQPNIQDRINAKLNATFGEIDGVFDDFITSNYKKQNIMELLFEQAPPSNRTKDLIVMSTAKLQELTEVANGKDAQLNEAYASYGKRGVKQMVGFWEQAISDINNYGLAKKNERAPRKKKAISPDKMVSKLNFLKTFPELGLTSIDPVMIIRSSQLWTYNSKTRKLGQYVVSSTSTTFEVKGKKILNADPIASVQKTLRKPEKQLAEFASMGKPARIAWFKKIKATETKLKPAIHKEAILLSASK